MLWVAALLVMWQVSPVVTAGCRFVVVVVCVCACVCVFEALSFVVVAARLSHYRWVGGWVGTPSFPSRLPSRSSFLRSSSCRNVTIVATPTAAEFRRRSTSTLTLPRLAAAAAQEIRKFRPPFLSASLLFPSFHPLLLLLLLLLLWSDAWSPRASHVVARRPLLSWHGQLFRDESDSKQHTKPHYV